jgi:equilibrative nucleoside transporter 1/2/3
MVRKFHCSPRSKKILFSEYENSLYRYPLVLVAMFNVLDLMSRYIPLAQCIKIESRKGLLIATLSRVLFLPAFYFTAKYGDQGWMIMLTSILGLTNGYLSVCVMTVAPKGYKAC